MNARYYYDGLGRAELLARIAELEGDLEGLVKKLSCRICGCLECRCVSLTGTNPITENDRLVWKTWSEMNQGRRRPEGQNASAHVVDGDGIRISTTKVLQLLADHRANGESIAQARWETTISDAVEVESCIPGGVSGRRCTAHGMLPLYPNERCLGGMP